MTDNNGNLRQQDHWIPNASGGTQVVYVQTYAYDSLNRLQRVNEGSNWQQEFTYDRWGNRTIHQTNTFGPGINKKDFTVDPVHNQLGVPGGQSGTMIYDPVGNLTTDTYTGIGDRVYDAENRMTRAWGGNNQWQEYSYNADGQRTRRKLGTQETWQVYGMDGELLAEYGAAAAPSSPLKEYGYRNGQLLVTATATSGWGAPPVLNDNPLVVTQTTVQARHITELRDAINALRSHLSLSAYSWQYSVTTNDWITANPILEMRIALDQALGAPGGGYSAGLAQEQPIKAIHIQELRDRVLGAWISTGSTDIRWLVTDHLGTPRMIFDQMGSLANVSRHDYLPFGEELYADTGGRTTAQGYTASDNVRQKFTLKERDIESGLDYFGARYYSSTQGRFTSVDPSRVSIHLGNPQSWNRYSYTYNNPLALVDDNGKWPTRIHNLIIDRALPGLSKAQQREIKNGSYSVDDPLRGGQNVAQSNQHGMTRPRQSQEEAAQNADQFINENIDKAKWNYEHHGLTSSLYDFGRAFHTVSDMTSPAHEGYQVWNGGILHPYSTGYHMGEESSISDFRMGLAVGATLALYRYTYGQRELERATGYTPGSENDPTVRNIEAQYSLPGSDPAAEGEALYEYRLGLQEGLNFDWGRQRALRGRRYSERR
jgi:RHS repeat-associated protein